MRKGEIIKMTIKFEKIAPNSHINFFRTRLGIDRALMTKKESTWNLTTIEAAKLILNKIIARPAISPKRTETVINTADLSDIKGPISAMRNIKSALEKYGHNITSIFYCEFEERKDKEGKIIYTYKSIKDLSYFRSALYEEVFVGDDRSLASTDKMLIENDSRLGKYPD